MLRPSASYVWLTSALGVTCQARLRREVTREDVEKSLQACALSSRQRQQQLTRYAQIPFAERARVIGVDPARDDASELRRLPFAAGPQL